MCSCEVYIGFGRPWIFRDGDEKMTFIAAKIKSSEAEARKNMKLMVRISLFSFLFFLSVPQRFWFFLIVTINLPPPPEKKDDAGSRACWYSDTILSYDGCDRHGINKHEHGPWLFLILCAPLVDKDLIYESIYSKQSNLFKSWLIVKEMSDQPGVFSVLTLFLCYRWYLINFSVCYINENILDYAVLCIVRNFD